MRAFNVLEGPVDHVLGVYFHHCAIAMTCRQLAMAGRYLAFSGRLPGKECFVISSERARRISALMLTCGHYDGSGDFAFRVGLPGKSGVGGGILAVAPGKASIAVWSPGTRRKRQFPARVARVGAAGEGHALVSVRQLISPRRDRVENDLVGKVARALWMSRIGAEANTAASS